MQPVRTTRAAAYARYSTTNQTENSIEYQLAKIRSYCREHGIVIAATYTDEAKSGTNTDRPGFQAMVQAATRHDFDAVVIYDISRGSRDVGDWFTFRKTMLQLGVQVLSATQSLGDLTDGDDFLLELLSVGLGHREVLETRRKSMDGVAVRARQGAFLGGTPPLGYVIRDGRYVIDQAEARIVRTIFRQYALGDSYDKILDALKGARGKRGRPLGKNSLHSILSNERYVGTYTWCRREVKRFGRWAGGGASARAVRIEGAVPAIIDRETWGAVQRRMRDRRRNSVNRAKRDYLLSGLIECEECGGTYVGRCSRNPKGYETRYYVCGNKYRTKTCHAPNIPAAPLEAFVVTQLRGWLESCDIDAEAVRIAEKVNGASPDLSAERRELAEVERQIANGTRAVLSGLDVPELRIEIERLRARKLELEDVIGRRGSPRGPVEPEDVARLLRASIAEFEARPRAVIRQHVQKVVAHMDGTIAVHVGVPTIGCGGRT